MTDADVRTRITAEFPEAVLGPAGAAITVTVPPGQWLALGRFVKDALGFAYFSFMSAVDWKDEGLEVVAWVDHPASGLSVLMKSRLGAGVNSVASLVPVYRGAEWMERECYDMFGLQFEGHPDLRRMLLSDDWVGHPLLKSYAVDTPFPPYR